MLVLFHELFVLVNQHGLDVSKPAVQAQQTIKPWGAQEPHLSPDKQHVEWLVNAAALSTCVCVLQLSCNRNLFSPTVALCYH